MKRYSPEKATGMRRSSRGRYVTLAEHQATLDKLAAEYERRMLDAFDEAQRYKGLAKQLSDSLYAAMNACQEMHRTAADVAQRIGALAR